MLQPAITISLRCFGRPARTIRAIKCVLSQTINNWELLLTGDNCPNFETAEFKSFVKASAKFAEANGNKIICNNNQFHTGGCGFEIINQHIKKAKGKYFIFLSNDDTIEPEHLENYLAGINSEDDYWDFVFFDSFVEPYGQVRTAALKDGSIGHSELIVKTSFLQTMPPHDANYGHDWRLIQNMIKGSTRWRKAMKLPITYIVKSVPGNLEQGID